MQNSVIKSLYHSNPKIVVSEDRKNMTIEMARHSHIPADTITEGIRLAILNQRYVCTKCSGRKKRKCKLSK